MQHLSRTEPGKVPATTWEVTVTIKSHTECTWSPRSQEPQETETPQPPFCVTITFWECLTRLG